MLVRLRFIMHLNNRVVALTANCLYVFIFMIYIVVCHFPYIYDTFECHILLILVCFIKRQLRTSVLSSCCCWCRNYTKFEIGCVCLSDRNNLQLDFLFGYHNKLILAFDTEIYKQFPQYLDYFLNARSKKLCATLSICVISQSNSYNKTIPTVTVQINKLNIKLRSFECLLLF